MQKIKRLAASLIAGLTSAAMLAAPVAAANTTISFEEFSLGNINGQSGWSATGPYDQEVVINDYGYETFGDQSFRISNAVTSGSFGDHVFSESLTDEAGESTAENNGLSGGGRSDYFEASWDFASTQPDTFQEGLTLNISPDRGDGARMSYVGLRDTPAGLEVFFYDYQVGTSPEVCDGTFPLSVVATELDRTVPHNVKLAMEFVEGPSNDIVTVTVDGTNVHVGTSWEDYFTGCEGVSTRTVDSLGFFVRGTAAPATNGEGFLIDNLVMSTEAPEMPSNKDDCKNGGWKTYDVFKNQGDCVSFVASQGRNQPAYANQSQMRF